MNEEKILLDIGLKFISLDENCFGIFASNRSKMEKRFQKIKKIFPKATAQVSLNSCQGDFLVDLNGEKYPLKEINKGILFEEYEKEIKKSFSLSPLDMVKRIDKIQCSYRYYLKEAE